MLYLTPTRIYLYGILLYAATALPGCSVGMAASGHREQDSSIIFPGSNRAVIIAKLGPPETSQRLADGRIVDSYLLKKGNESSSGRAWAHAGLDVLSWGLWEIVATPYELAQSEERNRVQIVYDAGGTVIDVQEAGGPIPAAPAPVATVATPPPTIAPAALIIPVGESLSAPTAASHGPQWSTQNNTSAADTQLRNLDREFRAGRIGIDEYRQMKKVLQGE